MNAIPADTLAAMLPVIAEFERLGIDYYVGGSIASSLCGIGRSTLDVDIVANVMENKVDALVQTLCSTYYIDANMIREAIRRQSCFNLIHLTIPYKIDIFVLKNRKFDQQCMSRRRSDTLYDEDKSYQIYLSSPEDILLAKLEWYRLGDEISDKQWNDILGVMKVQRNALDRAYLEKWAVELGVSDILIKAWNEVEM
ncbi:MAG TPA: hypothetical protein VIH42_10125 [Thermoguttaceae bacterium]